MKELPASQAYRLFEPGPIVLVTTSQNRKPNIMTMGFHMMIQHAPPLIGCIIGPWDHSYSALRATGECVIAIPTVDLAEVVLDIGNCSGDAIDKFDRFGLTPQPASNVAAPLIKQCLANIECRVADTSLVDEYNLFILEAERIWIDAGRKEQRTMHHRAGTALGVQESAISRRIRDLEDRLGASLFHRHSGGVSLTQAGQRFLRQSRKALRQIGDGARDVAAIGRSEAGQVRVGIFSSLVSGFLSDLLRSYDQRHAGVRIELVDGHPSEHVAAVRQSSSTLPSLRRWCADMRSNAFRSLMLSVMPV